MKDEGYHFYFVAIYQKQHLIIYVKEYQMLLIFMHGDNEAHSQILCKHQNWCKTES